MSSWVEAGTRLSDSLTWIRVWTNYRAQSRTRTRTTLDSQLTKSSSSSKLFQVSVINAGMMPTTTLTVPFSHPILFHHSHSNLIFWYKRATLQRPIILTVRSRVVGRITVRAVREWQEYDEAVKDKDLARALRFLKDISIQPRLDNSSIELNTRGGPVNGYYGGPLGLQRDWDVLDTCLNADDMRLVGSAYAFLKDQGRLPNFGKYRNIVLEGPREITPTVLKSATGVEVSKLSPKKWGLSGSSNVFLIALLAGASLLVNQGIDIRPNLAAILGLVMVDAIFLGGSCLAQISSYWPPHKRRILVHEAGHLLVAYLMGCPIRGVILDPIVAVQMGIQGQAGTQFWDEGLQKELAEGRLSGTTFDRYCMVLFAGIAAEALVYGEAEGGENDENLFRGISVLLQPPLSVARMSNQARWAVLQSFNLLKWHKNAHRAAIKALEAGGSLGTAIRIIEEGMSSNSKK